MSEFDYAIEELIYDLNDVREIYAFAQKWMYEKDICLCIGDFYDEPNWQENCQKYRAKEVEIGGKMQWVIEHENSGDYYFPLELVEAKGMSAQDLKEILFWDEMEDWMRKYEWDNYMERRYPKK